VKAPRYALLLLTALSAMAAATARAETDPGTGLEKAPGWEAVRAQCGACHSHRLVTAQRGDAAFWTGLIRWMQATQNLWALPEPLETEIVTYLATHYNETDWGRRPNLPPILLPGGEDALGVGSNTLQ
jgi:hypothetical protein